MKQIVGYVKLQIPAGKANPAPPVGPSLSQKGVNIAAFCNEFNQKTKSMEQGMPVPVVVTVYSDRSFSFVMKTPPNSYFLKKAAKINKGTQTPGLKTVGRVSMSQIHEIAKQKMEDFNTDDLEAASRMIVGSARSMGLEVVE
ncbi:MAG: 50S ribosomal protein L11 [Alphaproteobacteria bacterium]